MELSKETKERIEKQSYAACSYTPHRVGYIVGAEAEALHSQQLVEALEEIIYKITEPRGQFYDCPEKLDKYKTLINTTT